MRNKFLFLFMFLLFLFQFINQVYFSISNVIFALAILIVFLLAKKESMLGVYIFLVLLSTNLMLYYLNIIFVIFLLIKFRKVLKINGSILLIAIIILIETIHVYLNINSGLNESVIKLFGFSICLVPFIFIKSFLKNSNILSTFYMFTVGFIGFTFITFGIYYHQYNLFNFFNEIRRFGFLPKTTGDDINNLIINPNTIGKYAALIISGSIALIKSKKMKINTSNTLIIFYVLFIGLLTLSRTFILIILIVCIIYFITNLSIKNIFHIGVIILIFLCLAMLLTFNVELYSALNERIFKSDNITGSRLDIYESYIKTLFENGYTFTFGVGMQDYNMKFNIFNNNITESSHNIIIETLSIWGLTGLIIIVLLFCFIIRNSDLFKIKNISDKILMCLPLLVIFLSAFAGQYFISYYHTFSVTYLALLFIYSDEVIKYDQR